jgi:hypothetical protein
VNGSILPPSDDSPAMGLWSRCALLLFPMVAALGPYASFTPAIASSTYFFRILCLVAVIPALAALASSRPLRDSAPASFVILVVLWSCWAPLLLLWSPDWTTDSRNVVAISFALVGAFTAFSLSKGTAAGCDRLRLGWTAAFVVTASIAAWEKLSGRHLETNPLLEHAQPNYIASTFFNPNDYASFLLACLAPLAWGMVAGKSATVRRVHLTMLVGCCCLIVMTQSRTGLLGAAVAVPLIAYWRRRHGAINGVTSKSRSPLALCAAVAAIALVGSSEPGQRLLDVVTSPFHEDPSTAQSDQTRVNLLVLGWRVFLDSGLLGAGSGAFERAALAAANTLDLGNLTKAHNSFVQLAAEFGLVLVTPLLVAVGIAVRSATRAQRAGHTDPAAFNLRMSIMIGALAFLAGGMAGSSTLAAPWWWLLFGSIITQTWLLRRSTNATPLAMSIRDEK